MKVDIGADGDRSAGIPDFFMRVDLLEGETVGQWLQMFAPEDQVEMREGLRREITRLYGMLVDGWIVVRFEDESEGWGDDA